MIGLGLVPVVVIVLAVVIVVARERPADECGRLESDMDAKEHRTPAPDFPGGLDWINSPRPLCLRDLRGKFVLIEFWTYC
ncbi:MAG: hypothetical protein HY720_31535 [Planctomycetes bacterium]|nr:hypothetical protein [Planctomycetota bacterium]